MRLIIASQSVPLQMDESNIVCIGKSRIPLATVVTLFNQGATVEEIVRQYPSLKLADVYIVIGYYLRHKPEMDAYLQRQSPNTVLLKSLTGRQERCLVQAHLNTAQALFKIARIAKSSTPAIDRKNRVQ